MEDFLLDTGNEETPSIEDGAVDSSEEAFMKGYEDEGNAKACPECGMAFDEGVTKEVDGEVQTFCSTGCAEDYEESLGA